MLSQATSCFDHHDRLFIFEVSGLHPYLLQLTANSLWEIHHDGKRGDERYLSVANELYDQTFNHFSDTWRAWSNAERKVVTAIALNQIPWLVEEHSYEQSSLIQTLHDYSPELSKLKNDGTIAEVNDGKWCITQQAFLWWLTDEIKRATRDDSPFEQWLELHELGELLTGKEKAKWSQVAKTIMGVLSKGATTLIESFAKGFGEGIGKVAGGSG